jgi:hypothetical protein
MNFKLNSLASHGCSGQLEFRDHDVRVEASMPALTLFRTATGHLSRRDGLLVVVVKAIILPEVFKLNETRS